MMPDIFSSFDPFVYNSTIPMNWMFMIINLLFILMVQTSLWLMKNRVLAIKNPVTDTIFTQLSRTSSFSMKGLSSIMTALFMLLVIINLMGLIPYTFSTSSHLIFTMSLGLPIWLSLIISSFTHAPKKSIAHFLPDGAPDWLNPFLVLIETTSVMVRPMTLSFRLAANMSAGHIVLSLMGIYCASAWFNSATGLILLVSTTIGYILFEVAICLIQAYIFCLLLSLYSDDHAH